MMTNHRVIQKIIRGDTFEVRKPLKGCTRIRIAGLDEQDGSKLTPLLKERVTIYPLSKKDGTLVAYVSFKGYSLTNIVRN